MSEADSYNSEDLSNEQLVAYLDGELDAESSVQLERRLAEDEDFRRELKKLQRTWDMLDEIPKSEVSESFTQTTVEMVVFSAEHELQKREQSAQRKSRTRWLIGVSGFVATAFGSYLLMTVILARSRQQLLRDLPVIEDVELYRVAESVDYLRQLDESGLFDEEVEDAL